MHHPELGRKSRGFTLIELLVVVMIIAILAATALPKYFRTVERSKTTEVTTLVSAINMAEQRYYLQNSAAATDLSYLDVEGNCSNSGPTSSCTLRSGRFIGAYGASGNAWSMTFSRQAIDGASMLGSSCSAYALTYTGDASGAVAGTWGATAACSWVSP